jgi:hypothetical protein
MKYMNIVTIIGLIAGVALSTYVVISLGYDMDITTIIALIFGVVLSTYATPSILSRLTKTKRKGN